MMHYSFQPRDRIVPVFTNCISEINNKQTENAKSIDIVMPMYNLIEYCDNYFKTSGSLPYFLL